jgi:hypothetical protein
MRVDNTFANPASDPVNPVKEVNPIATLPVDVGIATPTVDTSVLEQHLAEAQARNESVKNPEGATTAEQGAVNEPGNTPSVVSTTNVSPTSPDAGNQTPGYTT